MIYFVMFDTQRNRCTTDWIYHCEAKNAAEAAQIAKQAWIEKGMHGHQFHLHAKKSRIQDKNLLRVQSWKTWTAVKEGDEVMNHFIAIGTKTWLKRS